MGFILSMIKIIFLLGFLIFIHELGHFLIAKLCKVKVNEFAIGFGPCIWKKISKETTYELRLVPLGGFVNMEGEEERSENEGSFSKTSISKRIAIVSAGGITNIVFGLILFFILSAIFYARQIEGSNIGNWLSYGFNNTLKFLELIIVNLKMLFSGHIDVSQLTRANWNIYNGSRNNWNI